MPHEFPVSVYYEDTDMGGIVYHANYLRFIERARSHWVRSIGQDQNALREAGLIFAVSRIEADYLAPARFEDALIVETTVAAVSPARLTLHQTVRRDGTDLFRAVVTVICMTLAGKPQRLPAEIRAFL
ncbi:tol-pal system-associated acyl-CoA thioesterase [Rhodobacteraceae bacterium M382]|nr:tol-pal system-associated acyl-CoA thioesterase [Rhodobacteraceae bacterium M382]